MGAIAGTPLAELPLAAVLPDGRLGDSDGDWTLGQAADGLLLLPG